MICLYASAGFECSDEVPTKVQDQALEPFVVITGVSNNHNFFGTMEANILRQLQLFEIFGQAFVFGLIVELAPFALILGQKSDGR